MKMPVGLELTLSNVNQSLGSGVIAVTNAGGTVLVSKSGVSGNIYGALSANVPNVSFQRQQFFAIGFGGGNITIGGTGVNLTAYGQQIGGQFHLRAKRQLGESGDQQSVAVAGRDCECHRWRAGTSR